MSREAWKAGECPRPADHLANAIDRFYPTGSIPSWSLAEKWDAIKAEADEEHAQCEGH